MRISNSKKQLARIISENGGWREQSCWAAQDKQYCGRKNNVGFYDAKPPRPDRGDSCWGGPSGALVHEFEATELTQNWHQTILSREEYFSLYPVAETAPEADGWIEWSGGECPVGDEQLVRIRVRGEPGTARGKAGHWSWGHSGCGSDIIAYRLHKPDSANSDPAQAAEAKPTIEQLAADYHNRKDYADCKQQEADAAKADAEGKLAELVAAGKAIGLVLSVAAPEPEAIDGEWVEYSGGGCPVGANEVVEVFLRKGRPSPRGPEAASEWDWTIDGDMGDILKWRKVKGDANA